MTALTDLTDCVVVYADDNMFLGQGSGVSRTTGIDSKRTGRKPRPLFDICFMPQ